MTWKGPARNGDEITTQNELVFCFWIEYRKLTESRDSRRMGFALQTSFSMSVKCVPSFPAEDPIQLLLMHTQWPPTGLPASRLLPQRPYSPSQHPLPIETRGPECLHVPLSPACCCPPPGPTVATCEISFLLTAFKDMTTNTPLKARAPNLLSFVKKCFSF